MQPKRQVSQNFCLIVAIVALLMLQDGCCQDSPNQLPIPGLGGVSNMLSASAGGMSRYFAGNGPIQPALTAIGGLPLRATEYVNSGLTTLSNGLQSGSNAFRRGDGSILPQYLSQQMSQMTPSFAGQLGNQMRSGIASKNNFIRGQAQRAVDAGNRLSQIMNRP